jgi:hypothetical protein
MIMVSAFGWTRSPMDSRQGVFSAVTSTNFRWTANGVEVTIAERDKRRESRLMYSEIPPKTKLKEKQ